MRRKIALICSCRRVGPYRPKAFKRSWMEENLPFFKIEMQAATTGACVEKVDGGHRFRFAGTFEAMAGINWSMAGDLKRRPDPRWAQRVAAADELRTTAHSRSNMRNP
ncbi:unnamed protein product [Cuscuta europaea]|uniref:Uncharacterized protein n=1 Tax=Cuscuta europaea TaxID=41803 RepID=A0A9P0ZH05_CUSEU|nr:unnamed protein product [Cuscuta europaea]